MVAGSWCPSVGSWSPTVLQANKFLHDHIIDGICIVKRVVETTSYVVLPDWFLALSLQRIEDGSEAILSFVPHVPEFPLNRRHQVKDESESKPAGD